MLLSILFVLAILAPRFAYSQAINGGTGAGMTANNSIYIYVNPNGAGEISALIYPYTNGENLLTHGFDHLGGTNDGGIGADINDCGTTKHAFRWDPFDFGDGAERQWGVGWNRVGNDCNLGGNPQSTGPDGDLTRNSSTSATAQLTPSGTRQSVVVTNLSGDGGQITIVQKTIIRGNNQWFAVVYYITDSEASDWYQALDDGGTGLNLFYGSAFNMDSDNDDDNATYYATPDAMIGNDEGRSVGFASDAGLIAHDWDVNGSGNQNTREDTWVDIRDNSLDNNNSMTNGNASGGMRWNVGDFVSGETRHFAIVWGVGTTDANVQTQIATGLGQRYDTGISAISSPTSMQVFAPGATVTINATAALYGVVDASDVPVNYTITRSGGGAGCGLPTGMAATPVTDLYIDNNVANMSETVAAINWDTTGCNAGTYTIQLCTALVSPAADQTPANDCSSVDVILVNPNNPSMQSVDTPANLSMHTVGDMVAVTGTAALVGTVSFPAVPVEVTIVRLGGGAGCALPSMTMFDTVTLLWPGMTTDTTAPYNWNTAGCAPGDYNIEMCTALGGDTDTSNDCQNIDVELFPPSNPAMQSIDAPADMSMHTQGDVVTIDSTAELIGFMTINSVPIELTITPPGPDNCTAMLPSAFIIDTIDFTLAGTPFDVADFMWDTAGCDGGGYNIEICTNYGSDVDTANDCMDIDVTLNIPPPDATLVSIGSPAPLAYYNPGSTILASSTARNLSITVASPVQVLATVTKLDAPVAGCSLPSSQLVTTFTPLPMSNTAVPTFAWATAGCAVGTYQIELCTSVAMDGDAANDCKSVTILLGAINDIGVSEITRPINGSSIIVGSQIIIGSRVTNFGNLAQSENVYLTVTRPDMTAPGCTLPSNQASASPVVFTVPGASVVDAPDFTWNTFNAAPMGTQCNTGNYLITVCTALSGDVDTSNDCRSVAVNLIPGNPAYFINGVEKDPPPPVPNNSMLVAIEPGTMGTTTNGGGELGTILFPFNDGDTPSRPEDHFGDVGDNVAWELDDCAGGKIAVRWDPTGVQDDLQYGSAGCVGGSGADGTFTNVSQEVVTQNTTPSGEIESVIVTRLRAAHGTYPVDIVQKTIIRENNLWFATVYYVSNASATNFDEAISNAGGNGVVLLQGVDYNFNGTFANDSAFIDAVNDTAYGRDNDAFMSGADIAFGGFSAGDGAWPGDNLSNASGVQAYITMWNAQRTNDLASLNQVSYDGDASAAMRWNLGTLVPEQTSTIAVIWGIGDDQTDMQAAIDAGLAVRWDAGITSIDGISPGETFINGATISIGATAALFGVVDAPSMGVTVEITRPDMMATGCTLPGPGPVFMGTVSLAVPAPETGPVPEYFWDTTGCNDGTYNIEVCTTLLNDQVPANNCENVDVDIVDLVIRLDPNQAIQVAQPYPSFAEYPVVLENQGPSQCVSFLAGASSRSWATRILNSTGSVIIAEDSDGDGDWDLIDPAYDNACGDGQPGEFIADGTVMTQMISYLVRKIVPMFAPLAVTDSTIITVDPSVSPNTDSATFLTSTEPPPIEVKTLHLHDLVGAVTRGMDTVPETDPNNTSTTVPALSVRFFTQSPAFQTPFKIVGGATDIDVALYIGTNNSNSLVSISMIATNGMTSISLGSDARSVNQPNNTDTPTFFSITVNDTITIPSGYGISLEVRNLSGNAIGVWHDNTPASVDFGAPGGCPTAQAALDADPDTCPGSSQIVMRTTTYVNVPIQNAYLSMAPFDNMQPEGGGTTPFTFDPTGTAIGAYLRGFVEDPFGKQDIGGGLLALDEAVITVTDPNGDFIKTNDCPGMVCADLDQYPMPLAWDNPADETGMWYEMGIPLQTRLPGTYTVCIQGQESNGAISGCTFQFVITSAAAIELLSFDAIGYADEVHVHWTTGQEIGTHGFNLYRSTRPNGGFVQINPELIAGLGYSDLGGTYIFADDFVQPEQTYYYLLEEVEFSGQTTNYGPVSAFTRPGTSAPAISSEFLTNPIFPDSAPPEWAEGTGEGGGVESGSGQIVVHRTEGEDGSLALDIEISVPDAVWDTIALGETTYDTVSIAGYALAGGAGEPALPAMSFLVDVPSEMSFLWDLVSVTSSVREGVRIVPSAPAALPDGALNDAQDVPAGGETPIEDPAIYGGTEIVPGLWADIEPGPVLPGAETLRVSVYPVQFDPDALNAGVASHLSLHVDLAASERRPTDATESMARHWEVVSGAAAKLLVTERGIQQVTGTELAGAGLDLSGDSANLQLFHHGVEVPLALYDGGDGAIDAGDVAEFYGEPAVTEYTRTAAYWLVMGSAPGLRASGFNGDPTGAAPVSGDAVHLSKVRVGDEKFYFSTLNAPGAPHWFHALASAPGGSSSTSLTASLTDLVKNPGDQAVIGYELRGSTAYDSIYPDQHVRVSVNGTLVDEVWFDGQERFSRRVPIPADLLNEGANTLSFAAVNDVDPSGKRVTFFVRIAEVFYPRAFEAEGDALRFAPRAEGTYTVTGFEGGDIRVYDVADPRELAVAENTGVIDQGGSYDLEIGLPAAAEPLRRTLLAVTDASVRHPAVVAFAGSNLMDAGNGADYVVVTHADFAEAVAPLAALRAAEGMRVKVIDIGEVYDVFSFGELDPWSLKELFKRAASAWQAPAPRYAVLVGDSTYDALDRFTFTAPGQLKIPTVLYDNDEVRASSDNSVVLLDHDLIPDVGIGRIPAKTVADVENYVTKVLVYEALPFGAAFTGRALLVADNATGQKRVFDYVFGEFIRGPLRDLVIAAGLAANVISTPEPAAPGGSLPAGVVSGMRADIAAALSEGVLLASYAGHGINSVWADEQIFRKADIALVDNDETFAVMAVFNCLNAVFADPFSSSMGEDLVLLPNSGAIALLGPTGFSFPNIQHAVGGAFYRAILEDGKVRLGDAARAAYAAAAASPALVDVVHTWVLLGDPALRIKVNHAPVISLVSPVERGVGMMMTLDASGTRDPNGDPLSYLWEVTGAPEGAEFELGGADTDTVLLSVSVAGIYEVKLTVTDSIGASASQTLSLAIDVEAPPPGKGPDLGPGFGTSAGGCGLSGTGSPSLLLALLLPFAVFGIRRLRQAAARARR